MEELEKHGTPCTEHGVSYAHRCLCRRTRYKWNDDAHAHKFLCRHTACSSGGAARARRFACRHNPCSNRAVGCVSRCQSHHSPCSTRVIARVCRYSSHHNPCTNGENARARKWPCRHNPCSNRAVGCVSRCQSHHSPCNSSAGARARTSFFWSCLTASRRKARGSKSTLLRRRWRYFGAVNCQRSGWCGCDTRARSTRSGLTRSRGENVTVVAVSCNRFFASPPAGVGG